MKTLVITHVYELALPYLPDLFKSISGQTDSEFDFVVFNYGLSKPLTDFEFSGVEIENEWQLGIPEARDWAMKYALKNNYDLAIFIDADDTMALNRVEETKKCHVKNKDNYGFYYTNLYLMHSPEDDFFSGDLPANITTYKSIENSNCVGLSNFAINVKACKNVINLLNVPDYVVAYDWYFASILLLNKINGCLVNTKTYYRIHQQNTAGETTSLDLKTIQRTVAVKQVHFKALQVHIYDNQSNYNDELYIRINEHLKKYNKLKETVEQIEDLSHTGLSAQLNLNNNAHWWGII